MEVMLLLFRAWRDGHIVTIQVCQVMIWVCHTPYRLSLKLDVSGMTIHVVWHDASFAEIMVDNEVRSLIVVGRLEFLHGALHTCQCVETPAEQRNPRGGTMPVAVGISAQEINHLLVVEVTHQV